MGLVSRGAALVEAVAELPGGGAHVAGRAGAGAVEELIEPRLLPAPRF
ncbi:hypothetical protein [Streptomyces sp. NPDC058145]